MPDGRAEDYRPLALAGIVLGSLLLFAAVFVGYVIAPLMLLALFYVLLTASDRSKRRYGR